METHFNTIEKIDLHPLFESTMIGYFGNSVFPFRLGEILRGYSLCKNYSITFSVTFGTIILERILDMFGLIIRLIRIFGKALKDKPPA